MDAPKVFISYSHDSPEHRARVRALADRLCASGIDCTIDQYVEAPAEGWVLWMQGQLKTSRFVLLICTEIYADRVARRVSTGNGVKFEGAMIVRELYDAGMNNKRFIPVFLDGAEPSHIPEPLKDYTYYVLGEKGGYEQLYRHLTKQHKITKPPIGQPLKLSPEDVITDYSDDTTKTTADELKAAYETLYEQERQDLDTTQIRLSILDLRRKMRENGLKAGDLLAEGRYELLRPIGRGGFARVWKALDRHTHHPVAVKVLHQQFSNDATRRERFFRGAKQMAKLQHPNLVRVLDAALEDGGYHFFVMEYVTGGDFQRAVREKRLTLEERWRVVKQVGDALQHAHDRGVIHRDVKPANILIDADQNAKLTDFDLVRAAETTGGTRTGAMGTFVYAAPEMLDRPQDASFPADIYGLGMVATFAAHGRVLPSTVFRNPVRFVGNLKAHNAVKEALAKAVEWEVEERWPKVEAFCDALDSALKSAVEPPTSEPAPSTPESKPAATSKRTRSSSVDLPELSDDWKERIKVYAELPNQIRDPDQLLSTLDHLRQKTRNGNDLFHLDLTAAEVAKKWPGAARSVTAFRSRFYDHIPKPPEDLFRWIETKDGRVELWRTIPAGSFLMGSSSGEGYDREKPQHRVEILQPFQMACVPVTQEQFAAFDPDHKSFQDGARNPVDQVTWYQAVAFCDWLSQAFPWAEGARLPIEAEWEYSCRAGATTRYWSGGQEKDLARVAWYDQNSGVRTHPVGEKAANDWGLYDVHGNVWEWTLGGFTSSYETHVQGRAIDPAEINLEDPPKNADLPPPSAGSRRVIRGGSCLFDAVWARAAYRSQWFPWFEFWNQGFRVALPPPARKTLDGRP